MNSTTACMLLLLLLLGVAAAPRRGECKSPSPVRCGRREGEGCEVSNYMGAWACGAEAVVAPRSEEELVAAVGWAVRRGRKLKVVSRWSNSVPKLVCPGEGGPSGDGGGVVISSRRLSGRVEVDLERMTARCGAGMMVAEVVHRLAAHGAALPAATYWGAVSVGGAISTGAHGSSLWGAGGALHDHVVGLSLVVPDPQAEAGAKVVRLLQHEQDQQQQQEQQQQQGQQAQEEQEEDSEQVSLLDAARLSLGALGAISEVVLKIEPAFKRSVTLQLESDERLEERLLSLAAEHEFGDIAWHPGLHKMLVKMDGRVPLDTPGEGANRYRGFQGMPARRIQGSRLAEERIRQSGDAASMCKLAEMILDSRVPSGNGYVNDAASDTFTGFPVVGFNHLMQTSNGCEEEDDEEAGAGHQRVAVGGLPYGYVSSSCGSDDADDEEEEEQQQRAVSDDSRVCNWDPRINGTFFHQVAFSVPLARLAEFIADVKKLRDMDASSLCGLSIYGGVYLRFVKRSTAYLGQIQDGVEFDFTFYRSKHSSGRDGRMGEDVVEEIEQMAVLKYGARPHWGKNRDIAFSSGGGMEGRVRSMAKFERARRLLDPHAFFSSQWTQAALGQRAWERVDHDGCALDGLCICSRHRHCAPLLHCRPGRLFPHARVCRRHDDHDDQHDQHDDHGDDDVAVTSAEQQQPPLENVLSVVDGPEMPVIAGDDEL